MGDDFHLIGRYYEEWTRPFCGSFDGKGHVISNFSIRPSQQPSSTIGLLCYTAAPGRVANVHLVDAEVCVEYRSTVGGLVGRNAGGVIENCSFQGRVAGYYSSGGVVGLNEGLVLSCRARGQVETSGSGGLAGGLVGDNA